MMVKIAKLFADIFKDATVGDVHADAALPDGKKRRKTDQQVDKLDAPRTLKPYDENTAHSPFPYDPAALANLRSDQKPRFFGALTDPQNLEDKTVRLATLTATQNRVDPIKVEAMRGGAASDKKPVVARMNGRNYIVDGHHRLSAAYLDGDATADVKFKDLTPVDNALKSDSGPGWSIPFKITKADPDQQLIFGWASVVEKEGHLVIDKQGDIILPEDLEKAAYDFVLYARQHGDMHKNIGTGRLVESMVFTKEKQAALGIDLKKVGWFVGFRVDDPEVWQANKRGDLPEFSIGGSGKRIEV